MLCGIQVDLDALHNVGYHMVDITQCVGYDIDIDAMQYVEYMRYILDRHGSLSLYIYIYMCISAHT